MNTSIPKLQVESGKFYFVRSDTTRPRRIHGDRLEENGEFYWHIKEDDFIDGLKNGDYLEAAIIHNQQVSGSNSAEYEKATTENKVAITDIEGIYGPPVFHNYSKKAQFIFLIPPGFREWMDRLNRRGKMSHEELKNRLISAEKEIVEALKRPYYHFMVSVDIEHNVQSVMNISEGKPGLDSEDEAKAKAKNLLEDIRNYRKEYNF